MLCLTSNRHRHCHSPPHGAASRPISRAGLAIALALVLLGPGCVFAQDEADLRPFTLQWDLGDPRDRDELRDLVTGGREGRVDDGAIVLGEKPREGGRGVHIDLRLELPGPLREGVLSTAGAWAAGHVTSMRIQVARDAKSWWTIWEHPPGGKSVEAFSASLPRFLHGLRFLHLRIRAWGVQAPQAKVHGPIEVAGRIGGREVPTVAGWIEPHIGVYAPLYSEEGLEYICQRGVAPWNYGYPDKREDYYFDVPASHGIAVGFYHSSPHIADEVKQAADCTTLDAPSRSPERYNADVKPAGGPCYGHEARLQAFIDEFVHQDLLGHKHTPDLWQPLDEKSMGWCHGHRDQFIQFLKDRGHEPAFFGVDAWEDLRMPLPRDLEGPAARRRLLRMFQLWREEAYAHLLEAIGDEVKRLKPEVDYVVGVFSPLSLNDGFYSIIPWAQVRDMECVDLVSVDTYVWCGHDADPRWLEEMHEFLADVTGKPQLPMKIMWTLMREWVLRLALTTTLVKNDDVNGALYFNRDIPYHYVINPREDYLEERLWGVIDSTVAKIKLAYRWLKCAPEVHRVLVVAEDPIWRNSPVHPAVNPQNIGVVGENPAFLAVNRIGYDADFCIPRQVPEVDLRQYDVVILGARVVGEPAIETLAKWDGQVVLWADAAGYDEWLEARAEDWAPEGWLRVSSQEELSEPLRDHVDLPYVPWRLDSSVDVDYRMLEDRPVFTIINYGPAPAEFAFEYETPLRLERAHCSPREKDAVCRLDVSTVKGRTHIQGDIDARDFEILFFRPAE
ncbi:MAG: hypothetical protein U9R79_14070 [Armatimonadota bacterium]|nr:hypothetical protein [Armatimonadota bacterium]